jgi:EmrB/QacA subfamily drug resistance transporter
MNQFNFKAFALLVALAGFMELFDGTVIQTALPAMARDLGVTPAGASVTMAAYFAAAAGAIPVCAWLTERLGARTAFAGGVAVFALASLFCGASQGLEWLICFRILQGLGGAVMMSVGQITILRDAPKDKLLSVTAYLVWPALAAPVLAPVVGGFVTEALGWRWLFWLNIPLGVAGLLASLRLAPKKTLGSTHPKLDAVGAALLALGLATLVPSLGLVEAGASAPRLFTIGFGLISLTGGVLWLLKNPKPLLNLRIFRYPTFLAGNATGALYRAVISAIPILLTLKFQLVYGWNPVAAGLLVMVLFVGNLSIKPFANFSVRRWGYRRAVVTATLVGAASLAALALVGRETSLVAVIPLLYISGAARSVGFTSYMTMQYLEVPKEEMPGASPLSNSVQQVATALGIAAVVGSLTSLELTGMTTATAYVIVFLGMSAVLCASAIWVASLLKRH